jgi:hypothetical protein
MIFRIEVAHTRDRYLTCDQNNLAVIHNLGPNLLQTWELVPTISKNIYQIKLEFQEDLYLIASGEEKDQISIGSLPNDMKLTYWELKSSFENLFHYYYFYIMSKFKVANKHILEMAVYGEATENGKKIVMYRHQGLKVQEPRNQMWILYPIR